MFQSPRNLPLGRNRRVSDDIQRGHHSPSTSEPRLPPRATSTSVYFEMPGSVPVNRPAPTSNPTNRVAQSAPAPEPPSTLDVVAELSKWRRERKAAYEQELVNHRRRASSTYKSAASRLAETEVYVEGYWSGEVKVVRHAKKVQKGKLERQGNVDIYGNYFEGGYLYP